MKKSLLFISALVAGATSFAQVIPNGNFKTFNSGIADQWTSFSSAFTGSAKGVLRIRANASAVSANDDSTAVYVTSQNFGTVYPGVLVSGTQAGGAYVGLSGVKGGFNIATLPKTLSGFARYVSTGSNHGGISVIVTHTDPGTGKRDTIGSYFDANNLPVFKVSKGGGFANFNLPITYDPTLVLLADGVNDSAQIVLLSSIQTLETALANDSLFVDQLRFLSCTINPTASLASAGITSDDQNSGISGDGVLNLPSTDAGSAYNHTFTIAIPDPTTGSLNAGPPIGSISYSISPLDSIQFADIILPGGLTFTQGHSSATAYGNSLYCFSISGNLPATTSTSYKWDIKQTPYGKINLSAFGGLYTASTTAPQGSVTNPQTNQPQAVDLRNSKVDSIQINIGPVTPTITLTSTSPSNVLTSTPESGYKWYRNGVLINGATAQTYTVTQVGNYRAIVTYAGIESDSSNITPIVAPPTPTVTASGVGNNELTSSASTGNQWYFNGAPINAATADTYTATAVGVYYSIVTVSGIASASSNTLAVTGPPTPTITAVNHVLTSSASTGNQWYKNGTIIPGEIATTYTATANGSYTVKSTVNGIASAASNTKSITDIVTGIAVTSVETAVSVFPNPSTGAFSVKSASKIVSVDVVNTIGSVVLSQQVNATVASLDLSKEQNGVYFVKIISENGIATVKVVLSK